MNTMSSAQWFLLVGLVVGPTVLNVFHFNPLKQSALLEVLTEAAVLISLYAAVFFAAVALRQTEQRLADVAAPAAGVAERVEGADAIRGAPPSVSGGSLVFKEHLERLSEVLLILLIGGSLFLDSWSWRAVGLAAFLFAVARPLSVLVGLLGSGNSWRICGLAGWFGVRGIGSLYYLMYAIEHGLPKEIALELIHMTLIVVTLSILVHGISVKPLMERFWSRRQRSH
ncbi:MAG: cation:proton antiporter [Candidatus Accumulibacter sp.]|uniref:Cation:proton antiporter n=1 Tax=Candidatus Accumulibacter proximus TaxID=2954385 RepID=A0A935Q443_9PROT|nr:cation:proton antiporter [Candidatus Accumulibacter proximus]